MTIAEKIQRHDPFEDRLRLWGWWYGEARMRREEEEAELEAEAATGAGLIRSPGGIFERRQSEDPLEAVIRLTHSMDRGGLARRRLQGAAAGLTDRKGQVAPVPAWAADPVRCAETRGKKVERTYMPQEAIQVESAVIALQGSLMIHGRAVRLHYCTFGGSDEKADKLGIGKGKFRELVAEGRGWIRCRLAA